MVTHRYGFRDHQQPGTRQKAQWILRPSAIILAVVTASAVAPACSTSSGPSTNKGKSSSETKSKTVTVGVATLGGQYVDPELANAGGSTYSLKWAVGEGLVRQNWKAKFVPALATGWSVSSNKLVWTFNLRKGVKMQDGSTFNAADVKASIDRIDPSQPEWATYANVKKNIASIKAVNDSTVEITTKAPEATLPRDLPDPIAAAYYNKVGEKEFRKHPIAAGPFKAVKVVTNQEIVLKRFDGFYDKSRLPNFENLVIKIIPDESSRLAALQSGEIDVDASLTAASADSVKGSSNIRLVKVTDAAQPTIQFAGAPTSDGLLDKKAVRQALSMGIDRKAIATSLYRGYAKAPKTLGLPTLQGCDESSLPGNGYNPNAARKLLAEAGASNLKFTFHLYAQSPTTPQVQQLATAVAGYWKQIGVDVKLDVVAEAPYLSKIASHQYKGVFILTQLGNHVGAQTMEPGYASSGAYSGLQDSHLDQMFNKLDSIVTTSADSAERTKYANTICDYLNNNVLAIPLLNLTVVAAIGPKIASYKTQVANPYPGPFGGIAVK